MGKGENAVYQHFLLSDNVFDRISRSIECTRFIDVFNIIVVITQWPEHLSMLSSSSFTSPPYNIFFYRQLADSPHKHCGHRWESNEIYCNDHHLFSNRCWLSRESNNNVPFSSSVHFSIIHDVIHFHIMLNFLSVAVRNNKYKQIGLWKIKRNTYIVLSYFKKYITRLGELITLSPRLDNNHFSQPH